MSTKKCPCGNGDMKLTTRDKKTCVNGVDLNVESEVYVCPHCGIEAGTIAHASQAQRRISEAYRQKTGLLTGDEIRCLRMGKGLDQKQLADLLGVNSDMIRKWEEGLIQDHLTDRSLRRILT